MKILCVQAPSLDLSVLPSNKKLCVNRKRQRFIKAEIEEVRVCTNRSCRRQGSIETLETLSWLAPPNVSVKSCGCLGRCGAGPNVALLPDAIIVGHCGTAARAAEIILSLSGCNNSNSNSNPNSNDALSALSLMKRAEVEIDKANFSEADLLLSQAIHLNPFGAIHIIYKHRSRARLAMGNYTGALEDARQALTLAPQYLEAYICQGDAFLAMDQYDAAEKSYSTCLEIDPSIRRSKSFKTRIAKLQEKLTAAIRSEL